MSSAVRMPRRQSPACHAVGAKDAMDWVQEHSELMRAQGFASGDRAALLHVLDMHVAALNRLWWLHALITHRAPEPGSTTHDLRVVVSPRTRCDWDVVVDV